MRVFRFQTAQFIPRPRKEVFAFFSDAANLQAITPPWLQFHIETPGPIELREGALIDYRLRLHGLPVRWRTRIRVWDPPRRFVDEQVRGPYRLWSHEHRFEDTDGGTRVLDSVDYAIRGGRLVNRLFVSRDVNRIFNYRAKRLAERFAPASETAPFSKG